MYNLVRSVSSILIGLQSFMTDNAPAAGTMVTSIAGGIMMGQIMVSS